jgi:6-pyruvoyltetrahydropterin/6-carboxytetrahydropterin synthase
MHFSASHFVRSDGDTENLHGHNYSLGVYIEGPLNKDGMVLDFRDVKHKAVQVCGTLDHKVILPGNSSTVSVKPSEGFVEVHVLKKRYVFPQEDCIIIPTTATTAELLAKYIHDQLSFADDFKVRVCVSESAGSTACYEE